MKNRILWLLGIVVPIAVIASIWVPPLAHYYVSSPGADAKLLSHLRVSPSDTQLLEIEHQNLALPLRMSDSEILDAAARLRDGELALKGFPAVAISPRFAKDDLRKGLPTWGLHFGSLAQTEILARAFEISRDDQWLNLALQNTLGFIKHERSVWLPDGFLWNDHAISGRISVLIKLWRLYRTHPDYENNTAQLLVEHILRCRQLLAKDSHFTFNTNHGVMQNVSLLQIAAAFPGLPDEERYRKLAIERLERQLGFYISPEGVVLEHSAEYHALGIDLLGMATNLLPMLDLSVPQHWTKLHRQAKGFLDVIRLPDDSLPMFGNTNSTPDFPPEHRSHQNDAHSTCPGRQGMHLYPVAGYAVTWSCEYHSTQSVLALSQFVGHGHKHADELSLLTWARNSRWLTNVGYWPYGVPGDEQAYGWNGSNAPHWPDETTTGEREPRLLSSGNLPGISFIEARRNGQGGSEFRRQVLQIGDGWWIVLDFAQGPTNQEAEVLWTFFPGISLAQQGDGSYLASQGANEIRVDFASNAGINHRLLIADRSPWRGWVVKDRQPTPAPSVLAHFPAGSMLVSSFRLADRGKSDSVELVFQANQSPDSWELAIQVEGVRKMKIARNAEGRIDLTEIEQFIDRSLLLTPAPDVRAERAAIRAAYSGLAADFPRYREVSTYRFKVTKILLAVFVGQILLFTLLSIYRRQQHTLLWLCGISVWISGGIAIHLWYFP